MIRNILGTFSTKTIIAAINFAMAIVIAYFLKAEGVGEVAKVVLCFAMVALASDFVGGAALVYLVPRFHAGKIVILSYGWAFLSSVVTVTTLHWVSSQYYEIIPTGFYWHLMLLSLLSCLNAVHLKILIGKEMITQANLAALLQSVLLVSVLLALMNGAIQPSMSHYLYAVYAALAGGWLFSARFVAPLLGGGSRHSYREIVMAAFKFGAFVQISNVIQLLNYRVGYYILDFYMGTAALGVYALGVQLSEGVWLICRSFAMVQYARIANQEDPGYARQLTVGMMKVSLVITLIALLPLLLMPASFFEYVFNDAQFGQVKIILFCLSPGILAVALNAIITHFFSGTGRHHINTLGSLVGFVFAILLSLLMIPAYGLAGGALAASVSYLASFVFQLLVFAHITGLSWRDVVITRADFLQVYALFRSSRASSR